jgi:creatinine amidohydrolase
MPPRPYILLEANYRQLLDRPPALAVLPWGATEAHNFHLPHGTDVIEATRIAERAAELAHQQGAALVVLPTLPFGNNAQQLDQVCTIHCSTAATLALLRDIACSLKKQSIDRLVILNAHGGNEFKPLVRDVQAETGVLIVVVNFFQISRELLPKFFEQPGDHADEMETSLLLHLCPDLVVMSQSGDGRRIPFTLSSLNQPGVWTPRPWSASHPDTGAGDPRRAAADKGARYFDAVTRAIAQVFFELATASEGQLPYL